MIPPDVSTMQKPSAETPMPLLRIPKRLRPGSTVGVAAPAGPFDRQRFESGVKVLETAGFKVYAPEDLYESRRYLAGSDRHRAQTVNRLFADPDIDAIICARGGFGSMRALPHLDFDLIGANPKVCIGFSDASALLVTLLARCHLATFHGPVVTTLAGEGRQSIDAMLRATAGDTPVRLATSRPLTIRGGAVTAAVSGGNLTTLCHLIGTPFEPRFGGRILFLEDCNEAAYRIDRMMSQMQLAGCLDNVAGILLGAFQGCGPIEDIGAIFADLEIPGDVPILGGLEVGHGTVNHTLPLGVAACLDADAGTLTYQQVATVA